jgi:hypothetical protein
MNNLLISISFIAFRLSIPIPVTKNFPATWFVGGSHNLCFRPPVYLSFSYSFAFVNYSFRNNLQFTSFLTLHFRNSTRFCNNSLLIFCFINGCRLASTSDLTCFLNEINSFSILKTKFYNENRRH